MSLGEYLGAGAGNTKLLLRLNGSSADSSGNNNNGTDTAITYSQANGKFGQGAGTFTVNPSNKYISIPMTGMPTGTSNRTMSFWIKVTSLTAGVEQDFIQYGTDANLGIWGVNASTSVDNNWVLHLGGGGNDIHTSVAIVTNTWHNVVITYDGTNAKMYLNGFLILTAARTLATGTTSFYIGRHLVNTTMGFNGSIDEVIIENVAWTPQQVQKYYSQAKGRFGII